MIYFFMQFLISLMFVLFSVMFITLKERKVLGYTQFRVGPIKVSYFGLLQPMMDGMKLIFKQFFSFSFLHKFFYYLSSVFFLTLMFYFWLICSWNNLISFKFSILFVLSLIGFSVYGILISGWISNSKYSFIGAVRSIAQTISYEISLSLMFYCFFIFYFSLNIFFSFIQKGWYFCFINFCFIILWFITIVAEVNRSPFDFSEGEPELVSGFNTEYMGVMFAFLFIAEYGMIIFYSLMSSLIWIKKSFFLFLFFSFLFFSLIILIRSVFPRFRYDKLMDLMWLKILPLVCVLSLLVTIESFFF